MHKFNESYTVQVVLVLNPGDDVDKVVDTLQECYDGGSVAGSFRVSQIGDLAVVTFVRGVAEDAEILLGAKTEVTPMTPSNVAEQLYREIMEGAPENTGSRHYAMQAATAINQGQYRVDGLPCQFPALTVSLVAYFEQAFLQEDAKTRLETLLRSAVSQVAGKLAVLRIEKGGAEEIAANA